MKGTAILKSAGRQEQGIRFIRQVFRIRLVNGIRFVYRKIRDHEADVTHSLLFRLENCER